MIYCKRHCFLLLAVEIRESGYVIDLVVDSAQFQRQWGCGGPQGFLGYQGQHVPLSWWFVSLQILQSHDKTLERSNQTTVNVLYKLHHPQREIHICFTRFDWLNNHNQALVFYLSFSPHGLGFWRTDLRRERCDLKEISFGSVCLSLTSARLKRSGPVGCRWSRPSRCQEQWPRRLLGKKIQHLLI